ncbi:MAG: hypothetical protein JO082_12195 [Mycobacterium sp.]|nr:hypothetical protein [Mycobacterium sp.]
MLMRRATLVMVAALVLVGCQPESPDLATPRHRRHWPASVQLAPPPPAPDLGRYAEVSPDDYLVTEQYTQYVSFRTPDGLTCRIEAIEATDAAAGCDGGLHGTPVPANEVELYGHPPAALQVEPDAFRRTSKPRFTAPAGASPAKTLPVGHKIVFGDFQCATAPGAITLCTRGSPVPGWFVLSPARSGIGPRSASLPTRFPDPHDFVISDQSYLVGSGARNLFPLFTVASGLKCKIEIFSGGAFGCDGPLPGAPDGENEIYVDISSSQVGMRKTDSPRFTTPAYPGTIRQLPPMGRIDYTYETYCTCLATSDGGVACSADRHGRVQGFVVSAHAAWTFGG